MAVRMMRAEPGVYFRQNYDGSGICRIWAFGVILEPLDPVLMPLCETP